VLPHNNPQRAKLVEVALTELDLSRARGVSAGVAHDTNHRERQRASPEHPKAAHADAAREAEERFP